MNDQQKLTLWIGSFRYYKGRASYAVSDFCELLIQEWASIPVQAQNLIRSELREDFVRIEESPELKLLGHKCDVVEWRKVMEAIA